MTKRLPFWYFKTNPEIIRLAVMLYVRFPLSLRNVEDLLHERGIDVSHETARFWWQRWSYFFDQFLAFLWVGLRVSLEGEWKWLKRKTRFALSPCLRGVDIPSSI